jgi:hypothetical protein
MHRFLIELVIGSIVGHGMHSCARSNPVYTGDRVDVDDLDKTSEL